MRHLLLTTAAALAALLAFAPPAWAAWQWPLHGELITPYRNGDDPYAGGQHRGIDIAGAVGDNVVAAAGGEVRFAGTAGSSGLTVSVRTADGFDTSYLHLSSISVRAGDRLSAGDRVGAVGTSGVRSAEQPHLHFGVREAGSRHAYRDPLDFLPPPPASRPAPESPHPAPAPVPIPIIPAPEPVPAPGSDPVGRRAPRRVPAGRRIPLGRRAPHRVPAGGRLPHRVPVAGRPPHRVPVGGRTPHHVPVGGRTPHRVPVGNHPPHRAPVGNGLRQPAPDAEHVPVRISLADASPGRAADRRTVPHRTSGPDAAPRPLALDPSSRRRLDAGAETANRGPGPSTRRRTGQDHAASGPDIGWVLACIGLLLAAALLGLSEDGQKLARTGRGRLARLLRPSANRA
jgi:hypothetical protein